jgi:hypothetical protein
MKMSTKVKAASAKIPSESKVDTARGYAVSKVYISDKITNQYRVDRDTKSGKILISAKQ